MHTNQTRFGKGLKSIRSVLLLAFVLCLVVPVLVMTIYGQVFTRDSLTKQALDRHKYEVHLQAQQFVHALESLHTDMLYLESLPNFQQLRQAVAADDLANIEAWRNEVEQDFLVFAATNPMFYRLRYLDNGGQEVFAIGADRRSVYRVTEAELRDLQNAEYMQTALALDPDEVYVSPFFLDNDGTQELYLLRYGLRLSDGVLLFDVFASWMLQHMPDEQSSDVWALIDRYGQHILYPFADESEAPEDVLRAANSVTSRHLERFLEASIGTFQTDEHVYIFTHIYPQGEADNFWILYHELPRGALSANTDDFFSKSILILIITFMTAFALALALSGQIIRPILDLQAKAEDFASGKTLPPPPKQMPIYELGQLTATFHEMARELSRQRQQKRRLIERLITAQEEERKLIAYDLHDGLIQQMVGARFYVSLLKDRCTLNDDEVMREFQEGSDALSSAIVEGRRIIEGLHPTILDDLGLEEAIAEIAHKTAEQSGWELHLNIEQLPHKPDKTVSVTIFRIVQEALNNVQKHSQAQHVSISLTNHDRVHVEVADDGVGFDSQTANGGKGFGISTMRERAELIGGTCVYESAIGAGTKVKVSVPYKLQLDG